MARTKGSVTRCGHCYEEGHNKRTCPQLKKEIENNPGGYYDRQAQRKKARAKKRQCTYCGETGHNMRTCQKAKEDRIRYSVVNWEYQQAMGTSMDQMGLGVGSIITREAWGEVSYWLITKINWDRINIANWYQCGTGNENCEGSAYFFDAQRVDTGKERMETTDDEQLITVTAQGGKEDIERFAKTLQLPERGKVYMKGIFEDEALPTEVTELVKDSLEKVSSEVEASDEINA